jgi:CO/xanthine dehydrogenase FAD-binding subunit
MAVSKVALGGIALLESGFIREVRLAAASLAPYPARLYHTEETLRARTADGEAAHAAKAALFKEILPIDDIRSTAEYRRCIAANLLTEFLTELQRPEAAR